MFQNDPELYRKLSASVDCFSVYNNEHFHRLEAERMGGKPLYYIKEYIDHWIVIPLIERSIPTCPSSHDLTMSYGYPTPFAVTNDGHFYDGLPQKEIYSDFVKAMLKRETVSCFLRFDPIFTPATLSKALLAQEAGNIRTLHLTDFDSVFAQYKKNCRNEIRKSEKLGIRCSFTNFSKQQVPQFKSLYDTTMRRVGARSDLFFDLSYYHNLISIMGDRLKIASCYIDDTLLAYSLFLISEQSVTYYLSCSNEHQYRGFASRRNLHEAIKYSIESNIGVINLGGGLGGNIDSLYKFKSSFGGENSVVQTSRLVVDENSYRRLAVEQTRTSDTQSSFPIYR